MKVSLTVAGHGEVSERKKPIFELLKPPKYIESAPTQEEIPKLPSPWDALTQSECKILLQLCAILSFYCDSLHIWILNRSEPDGNGGLRLRDYLGESHAVITVREVMMTMPWLLPEDAVLVSKLFWNYRVCNSIGLTYKVAGSNVCESFTFNPMDPAFKDLARNGDTIQ